MFLTYTCKSCYYAARVHGTEDELKLLLEDEEHSCPRCKGLFANGRITGSVMSVDKLSFKEFYNAINGMGLPNETVTHVEPVVAMLKACKIIEVDADEVNNRCIIKTVTLDNGVTLHLAASGYGAAVFKATRRGSDASTRT